MPGAKGQRPKSATRTTGVNVAPGARGLTKQAPPAKNGSRGTQRASAAMTNIRRVKENPVPGSRADCCG